MNRLLRGLGYSFASIGVLFMSGCINPLAMGIFTPIPVPPWTAERLEDQFMHKNDHRTPILPPILDGYPDPICEDQPTEAEVMRAIKRVARGVPFIYEEFRENPTVSCERLVDKIDPPRFFPLIGWARLHHCHWRCYVRYTETIQSDYPLPAKMTKRRLQSVLIDKDHLHLFVGYDQNTQREMSKEFFIP